jgi:hypothetical protein
MKDAAESVCLTPEDAWNIALWHHAEMGLILVGIFLTAWSGLMVIGFLNNLGEAIAERVRATKKRRPPATTDDRPPSPTP